MNREFKITATVTYSTPDRARAAVAKKGFEGYRHFIMEQFSEKHQATRYFPVFVGQEVVHAGIHFHFHVVG